jgi:2-polyprenyl-3-methyl-5-hydroxy-6-metoxy-1,4-benzoquinol methylase
VIDRLKVVSAYPKGFIPDLRRLRSWRSLRDSLWRNPDLVRLTYSELARLVRTCVGSEPCRILYVGPGLGHIALELARDGHHVTGVDVDQEAVALATRASETDPFRDTRGPLAYEVGEFPGEFAAGESYDRVLFSRVLHHIEDPAAAVAKAADLLSPAGSVVCVDFAHDRLGAAGARWMAQSRIWLSGSGWWPGPVAGSLEEETEKTAREWKADHGGEGLNPSRTMLDPLQAQFSLEPLAWHPYLFWDLAADMRVPADQEASVTRRMRDEETGLLRRGHLPGVLFSTRGPSRGRGPNK